MALTQEHIRQSREMQRAWIKKRLPREVREARRKSRFERVNGKLRLKNSNLRRAARERLAWLALSEFLPMQIKATTIGEGA
ncbi:hypothetical protein AQ808_30920 [Burkholderia pseudomallei]|uniref:hypothetical protein n=1 Tax=Burkholderia pseudomallei TaxID=28450 RepID=UPI000973826C|nr:hypothetical protein [Burkholderia pseudomallei]APY96630.1 hypothetical protein BGI50_27645 [Burkholderia pseudomallei]APZ02717.1 hypothetical protein BGI49_27655 [Burkholderia pseudomallei]APZ16299.1 hypothetical protein BGI52_27770 [Burkholderia pseudomallei]OMO10076.1 hypothetical protein BGI48_27790 [Burkholderia pseudomallei]OMW40656.1 hypothetical protein AQ808_30920 [Burkholderia pseudomallei]